MPKVLNARVVGRSYPGAVYIGRPSIWGNPFVVGVHGDRIKCVKSFEIYINDLIKTDPETYDLETLRGMDLICWCAPEACHGDILLKLANRGGIGNLDLLKEP